MVYHMIMPRREVLVQLDDELVAGLDRIAARTSVSRSGAAEASGIGSHRGRRVGASRRPVGRGLHQIPAGPCSDRDLAPTGGKDRTGVVDRNDIVWADLGPPSGRRPVCILTRDAAIPLLNKVTCAPITRTIRRIPSEVEVGTEHGLPEMAAINCDNVVTVAVADLDPEPVGHLDPGTRARLDRALRYSLDIIY